MKRTEKIAEFLALASVYLAIILICRVAFLYAPMLFWPAVSIGIGIVFWLHLTITLWGERVLNGLGEAQDDLEKSIEAYNVQNIVLYEKDMELLKLKKGK